VPAGTPVKVELVPVPVVVVPPGALVKVQVSDAGKPLNITLPVAAEQEGCVIIPTTGADGVAGCAWITTLADAAETHPNEFVTVYVFVPAAMPEMVLLAPVPAIAPGFIVQLPEGKPFKTTFPVATVQVGCVIVPTVGAVGVTGCVLITTFAETEEVHPEEFVTV